MRGAPSPTASRWERGDSAPSASSRTSLRLGLAGITLAAFTLRIFGIDQWGDLDFDEQASFFIGSMAPADMLRYLLGAPFEHPPLFYLVFHAWLATVGGSETAMRLFAIIPGTLAVPLLGFAVARVTDARTGIVAAGALALAPLHVFHSRDARMYSLLALLMAAMLAAIASGGARRGLAAAFAAGAALTTHYYAFFGVAGVAAAWYVQSRRAGSGLTLTRLRQWWRWVALGVVAAAGATVWALSASGFRTSLTAVRPRAVDPQEFLLTLLQSLGALLAGPLASTALFLAAAAAIAALLLIGWGRPSLRLPVDRGRSSLLAAASWGGFLGTTIGIPLLVLLSRPFAPRFVVLGTPFLAALLALGSRRLRTPVLLVAAAFYVGVAGVALAGMYGGYERSDYGRALAQLRAEARPTDGVILNGPWQDLLYRRYGAGLPPGQIVASTVPLQVDETVGWLRRITAEHPRVWVVDSATDAADPSGAVAAWLDANAYPRPVTEYQKAILRPYLTEIGEPLVTRPIDVSALGVHFTSASMGRWELAPGAESRLRIGAAWAGGGEPPLALRAVVDLLAPDGTSIWHWDGPLAVSGETLRYQAALLVPPRVAPGDYGLQITAYEAAGSASNRRVMRVSEPLLIATMRLAP